MWQEIDYASYQVWAWLRHEASIHWLIFLIAAIVIVSAVILYKTEVRNK